jgi:hypothetical protein
MLSASSTSDLDQLSLIVGDWLPGNNALIHEHEEKKGSLHHNLPDANVKHIQLT